MIDISKYTYNLKNDLNFYIESSLLTTDEVISNIGISKNTYLEICNDSSSNNKIIEKIYTYIYNEKYRINLAKEEIIKEKYNNKVLFHGSKNGLSTITNTGSRINCDFSNGFYLSESYENALSFVSSFENSSIYSFKYDISNLKVLKLECNLEWMLLICYFRGTIKNYENKSIIKNIIDKVKDIDLIIAPIADNKMFYIMTLFSEGDINADTAIHSLAASNLGYQYVFKTEKSLNCLTPIEKYYICKDEKKDCSKKLVERSMQIETKLKLAKREFKDGLYIEEILK